MDDKGLPKKKRGRKPKNIINNSTIDVKKENKINQNLIVNLKVSDDDDSFNILPGYSDNILNEYNEKKQYNCWNCCHPINNLFSIPLKYENNKFYIYGDFCSLGCTMRYIIDNYKNKELWNKYEIFNLYYRTKYGQNIKFNIPPNRLSLNFFGGNLTIDEYREEKYYNEMNNPIIIPINNQFTKKNNNINSIDKGDLKLYRRSIKKGQNIFNIQ